MEGRFPRNDQIIMITPLSPIWGLFLRFAPLGIYDDKDRFELLRVSDSIVNESLQFFEASQDPLWTRTY